MTRRYFTFAVDNFADTKQQVLNWISRFDTCCFLDNHQYELRYHRVECIAGAGVVRMFAPKADFFSSLDAFTASNHDWIFGHFNYDCKNYIEDLTSAHTDGIRFPDCFLFVPEVFFKLETSQLTIGVLNADAEEIFNQVTRTVLVDEPISTIELKPRISREKYIETVEALKLHIKRGDCYEINFCQEFFGFAELPFTTLYRKLSAVSPSPFSAFYRVRDSFLACSSPERYLQKTGNRLISQPIKGTASRNANAEVDEANREELYRSKKERAENIMIVDLVRNDMSKVCTEGSVEVDELMGVYSFPQVHQMISTITGALPVHTTLADVIRATFPMGSMTGAPKKKVMELVEKYEHTKRGIFSGAVGYITPAKDFDFNVVIRSLMYNAATNYTSYQVGSAITYHSHAVSEYEECLLKAKGILAALGRK